MTSIENYLEIFRKLSTIANNGAILIICDCSNSNLFAQLRLHNPFAPTIERHKHQKPESWADLLSEVGFINPRIRWTSINRFGKIGEYIFSNKYMAYLTHSHFCLKMVKKS